MNFWTENWKRIAGGLLLLAVFSHNVMGFGFFASLIAATCIAGAVYARSLLITSTWKRTGNAVLATLVVFVVWGVAANYLPETMNALRKNASMTDFVGEQLTKGDTTGIALSRERREAWRKGWEHWLEKKMTQIDEQQSRGVINGNEAMTQEAAAIATYRKKLETLDQFKVEPPAVQHLEETARRLTEVNYWEWLTSFTSEQFLSGGAFVVIALTLFGFWKNRESTQETTVAYRRYTVVAMILILIAGTATWGFVQRYMIDAVQEAAADRLTDVVEFHGKAKLVNPGSHDVVVDGTVTTVRINLYRGKTPPKNLPDAETRIWSCLTDDYGENDDCGWGLRRLFPESNATTSTTMPTPTAPTGTAGAMTTVVRPPDVPPNAEYHELAAGEKWCSDIPMDYHFKGWRPGFYVDQDTGRRFPNPAPKVQHQDFRGRQLGSRHCQEAAMFGQAIWRWPS